MGSKGGLNGCFVNFGDDVLRIVEGIDMTCKKCGHQDLVISPNFWYGGGEADGAEIEFHCTACDNKETIEED